MIEKNGWKRYFTYIMEETPIKEKRRSFNLIKRFGVAGFLFFLIKGLLWLIIPALAVYFGCSAA